MDQAALVKSDGIVGARVLEALERVDMPIAFCTWNYVPQIQEWHLIIATPWHDTKGPRSAYRAAIDALDKAGIYRNVPIRRVILKSPNDPFVKLLQHLQQQETRTEWRGFVHILQHRGNGKEQAYSIVFTPSTSEGAAPVLRFSTVDDLRSFLADELHVNTNSVQDALAEMRRTGAASIFPVTLSTRRLKKLRSA